MSPFLWIGGAVAAVALAVVVGVVFILRPFREPYSGSIFVVKKELLRLTIVERGNLESAENSDIICRVQARTKGSTIASTIKWVIDDGTLVKQGDVVVELDDSGFQEALKTQKNTVNKAKSDWIEANGNLTIQESQNESDIKTAEVKLNLTELALRKYVGKRAGDKVVLISTRAGLEQYLAKEFEDDVRKEMALAADKFTSGYLQMVIDLEGKIETARSDRETWRDRASWSNLMMKKGYFSRSQAEGDQSRLDSMEITLRKVKGDLDIYSKFERDIQTTGFWSDFKEAERALKRVDIQAKSKMEQKRADEVAKRAIYDQEDERLRDLMKEEKFYKIPAPQDGLIVYYIPEQARFGGGSQQATVAQGEPVREGQKLIRIPNLSKMMVNARVHEALVSKLSGEKSRPTGYSDNLRMWFGVGRQDLLAFASYQLGFDEIHDKNKDKFPDQEILKAGEPAAIRVDAYPGKQYAGRVKTVATVASQADFLSSDVKVYTTMVSIDNLDTEKLKPGMSAEVTILADEIKHPVLVMPIQSVIGNVSMGAERKCFVLDAHGYPEERDIVIGKSNDKFVEIKSGVQEGEKIVMNPGPLLPKKSEMKPGTPGTRRGAEFDDAGKKGAPKKGDGKKGDGAAPPPPNPELKQRSDLTPALPQNRDAALLKKNS